ncbi:MAG: class I SAM-dependent methyltransferase [Thermoplasmata archaeon]
MLAEETPDIAWVSSLTGASVARAHRLVLEAAKETALFRHIAREHRKGGRSFYVEIEAPLELYAMTRLLRPRHIVEVGVSSGVSSAYFLKALERNGSGTLHSVDLPKPERKPRRPRTRDYGSWAIPSGRSSGWAVPSSLKKRWDLRIGNKSEVLPLFGEEIDRIDLFLYDVPHSDPGAFSEFSSIDRRFPSGAVALADHGGTENLCPSLRRWADHRETAASGRKGLGLYGFRFP